MILKTRLTKQAPGPYRSVISSNGSRKKERNRKKKERKDNESLWIILIKVEGNIFVKLGLNQVL